jgi:hypothetical protein
MKVFIFTLFIMAAFCPGVHAQPQPSNQPGPPPRPTVKQRIDRLNDTLNKALHITTSQQKVVDDAYTQFFASADKLMGNNPPPRPDARDEKSKQLHEQILALQKQRDDAIAKVLTAEAFKKYQEIERSLRPGRPVGRQGMPPPPQQ